jgi:hypothetical protein
VNLATPGFEVLLGYATVDALDSNSAPWLRLFCELTSLQLSLRRSPKHALIESVEDGLLPSSNGLSVAFRSTPFVEVVLVVPYPEFIGNLGVFSIKLDDLTLFTVPLLLEPLERIT